MCLFKIFLIFLITLSSTIVSAKDLKSLFPEIKRSIFSDQDTPDFVPISLISHFLRDDDTIKYHDTHQNIKLLKVVSSAITSIVKTNSGRKLCAFLDNSKNRKEALTRIQYVLGVNDKAARDIFKFCLPLKAEKLGYKSIVKENGAWLPPIKRKYVFLNFNRTLPLDSWTTKDYSTVIFMKDYEIDYLKLVQILAHEISVVLDRKTMPTIFWYDHLTPLKNYEISKNGEGPRCKLLNILARPVLTTSLAVLRSFNFEKQVIVDLSKKFNFVVPEYYTQFSFNSSLECRQTLDKVHELSKKFALQIREFNLMFLTSPDIATGCLGYKWPHSFSEDEVLTYLYSENSQDNISIIKKMDHDLEKSLKEFKELDQYFNLDMCKFMSIPQFGEIINRFKDGPRPRLTGGS